MQQIRDAKRTQKTIVLTTSLIVVAIVMAGLIGAQLLSYYNHRDFHDSVMTTVGERATRFGEVVGAQLLKSAAVFDSIDKRSVERAWLLGNGREVQELLRALYPSAKQAGIAAMTLAGKEDRIFAAIGDAPRPRLESVPLTDSDHVWLYWADGWWLEHRIDIFSGSDIIAEWIAHIHLRGLYDVTEQSEAFIPGSLLAVCAQKDGEYPCLSMPISEKEPTFYLGENILCLTPDCGAGGREEEFTRTHGMVSAFQAIEGFNVSMVYYVPLADFFRKEQIYERIAILAVLGVSLAGLWLIFLQARPIARDLARTTVHMQVLMEKLPESVISVTEAGVIRTANPATQSMFGYDNQELVGQDVAMLLLDSSPARLRELFVRRSAGRVPGIPVELTARRKDGTHFPVELSTGQYRFENERHYIGICRDITERRRHEETLHKWARIFQHAEWGIVVCSGTHGLLEIMNPAFARMHGYTTEELIGRPGSYILAEESRPLLDHQIAVADQRGHHSWEARHLRKDGSSFVALVDITAIRGPEGQVTYRVMNIRDITDRKQRELQLEQQRAQLRELAANRESVREQERTRIAREIHDELGQSLTTLRMKAALLGLSFADTDSDAVRQVEEIKALIDQNIVVVRNVAAKLRPGALDLGIVSAIEWLAQDFEERTGILCGLDIDSHLHDIELDDERATMLFRILQESLTNVVRHAEAAHVEISFTEEEAGRYTLMVHDDGVGFDTQAPAERKTFGLLGIRERATVLGGKVRIVSRPGEGTTLELRIPIMKTEQT